MSKTTEDIIALDKLRDQFAMAALNAILRHELGEATDEAIASFCYRIADIMLEARDK